MKCVIIPVTETLPQLDLVGYAIGHRQGRYSHCWLCDVKTCARLYCFP